ncbi:uncharacterized protein EV422DRAFT_541540 [Fimicolochytrium jonesii]|uniref:uncharacterized protein n=1 Tax=Fimicolochytrium jonesii TaxID=1396493 RepID=UPI0022FDD810|nr:uncharacterized protein EV422DRAFT_541540 [Fimicolochytrium jonesii]KAI8817363.1 hypothetical protein EV422DRAFT_541540 [Fimicolochytrium jonesii]
MKITADVLESASTLKRPTHESRDAFLKRVSHVSLVNKGIGVMENLGLCRNLSVLYLYDNKITHITGLSGCLNLSQLYLQNNQIEEIEGLDGGLHALRILHLHGNSIQYIRGLHNLPSLEHLKLDRQRLSPGQSLEFSQDEFSVPLAASLKRLSLEGNKINDIGPIVTLRGLEELDLSDNRIDDAESVEWMVASLPHLHTLSLSSNPVVVKQPAKLRQRIIVAGLALETLNGKPIPENERVFASNFQAAQARRHRVQNSKANSSSDLQTEESLLDPALAAADEPKPVPHLPPYATQYRDLILQMKGMADLERVKEQAKVKKARPVVGRAGIRKRSEVLADLAASAAENVQPL